VPLPGGGTSEYNAGQGERGERIWLTSVASKRLCQQIKSILKTQT